MHTMKRRTGNEGKFLDYHLTYNQLYAVMHSDGVCCIADQGGPAGVEVHVYLVRNVIASLSTVMVEYILPTGLCRC